LSPAYLLIHLKHTLEHTLGIVSRYVSRVLVSSSKLNFFPAFFTVRVLVRISTYLRTPFRLRSFSSHENDPICREIRSNIDIMV
jgi:hypothetical protein